MNNSDFSISEKEFIAKQIKNISMDDVEREMDALINIGHNTHTIKPRSCIGNNVVDYFTFVQRLETKGKYDTNFYEFLKNIDDFKKKKFIQTMITYYATVKNKKNTKNEYTVLKEVYNICISAINILKPLNSMEIFTKYKSKRVLDFCLGWGGAAVAACALNLDAFYGVELNNSLTSPYHNMVSYLEIKSDTKFNIQISSALDVDYSKMEYDTVFTSPPYYFIQKYANNVKYESKKEMDEKFYKPVFTKTYNGLQKGGHYIINVCKEVYENVLKDLLGEPDEIFSLKKFNRQNDYNEMVYVWKKKLNLL